MIKSEYSYGTSGIINGLLSTDNRKFNWNILFINIMTLIRNCYEKNIKINDLVKKLKIDIENINFHSELYTSGKYKIHIIYYWPQYKKCVPTELLRKENKQNKEISILYDRIYSVFYKYYGGSSTDYHSLFDSLYLKSKNKIIDSIITDPNIISAISLFKRYKTINNIKPALISHIGLDYHLKEFFYNTIILLSFSSRLLQSNLDISEKVFKIKTIRFNKYSHYLFGDSTLIKPNISISSKRRLKEISKDENWASLTNVVLSKKLINNGFLDKSLFRFNIY
jgi:hypothetical protein